MRNGTVLVANIKKASEHRTPFLGNTVNENSYALIFAGSSFGASKWIINKATRYADAAIVKMMK